MAARRAAGEGSVHKRKQGGWQGSVDVATGDGRRRRKTVYGATQREVRDKLAAIRRTLAPGWYRASSDPVVGPALRMLHNDPAHPWTVAALARATGVSRAGLARRFTELVGEPPMSFLTGWRIALAADLLQEPGATVGSVAHQVGYGSPFALSTASCPGSSLTISSVSNGMSGDDQASARSRSEAGSARSSRPLTSPACG